MRENHVILTNFRTTKVGFAGFITYDLKSEFAASCLYLDEDHWKSLGSPKQISVTIEPVEEII